MGEAIPIEARIVAVADTFDVLTSDRPYRKARSRADARCVVEAEAGPHLDPKVVEAFLKTFDRSVELEPISKAVQTATH
jgi:HD-GYP domain-containing protein (c-di-GMP phosphodiesterase class II)